MRTQAVKTKATKRWTLFNLKVPTPELKAWRARARGATDGNVSALVRKAMRRLRPSDLKPSRKK